MKDDREFDVALSFAGEDRAYVKQVAVHLTDVYRNKAKYTLMFISEHYKEKVWFNTRVHFTSG